ncbi:regulatory LuxR family protein [Couchioplanes caeruleus]|uniref:Regulatory LuxR family protein n=2 Tax=Couchioplanes caeruleus TaxID=56438 RepID=A0A3N1GJM2_9ACTN|nr:regulatory LuxR family protein [Couchioplanes caeruleus]
MRIDGVTSTPIPFGAAIPSLVRWGMSSDADFVFRTLVTFGPRTERTIATELGLSSRRTAEALAELREGGAAVSTDDSRTTTRIWTARRPAAVVAMLRSRRMRLVDGHAKSQSHHQVVRALRSSGVGAALPLDTVPGLRGSVTDGMRYLSRQATRDRIAEHVATDIRDFWTMSNDQAIDAEAARVAAPQDIALYERGVRMRLLALPPADGDPLDVSGHLINGTTYQRRETPNVPLRLMLVDRRFAYFPADPNDLDQGYLEVERPGVLRALIRLFERHWDASVPPERLSVAPIVLSPRERNLITLLAAGHTDQSSAERLRISARSVTGIMRNLMDRLGVENRFQLGLALGALRVAAPPSLAGSAGESSHQTD